LSAELQPDSFTIANIGARLDRLKNDPWQDFFTVRQRLTKKMMGALQQP